MATIPGSDQASDAVALEGLIKSQVMQALGTPGERYEVSVRRLWAGRYRVNVLLGDDRTCTRIAHSFFLVSDGAGNILESRPRLARHY